MEVGTEISQKIRSAIKAKLMELGAYVDDELPDYIMVMVANKKNKSQMKADLSLFLGTNTDTFTSWLHGLLGKLQTITVESSKDKSDKSKSSKEKKKDKGKGGSGSQKTKSDSTKSKKAGKEKTRKRKPSHDSVEGAPKAKIAVSQTVELEGNESSETHTRPSLSSSIPEIAGDVTQPNKNRVESEKQSKEDAETMQTTEDEPEDIDVSNKQALAQEEFEDVRQLLVAVTPGDDLARELDATEEEEIPQVKKSNVISQAVNLSSKVKTIDSHISHQEQRVKRKVPSSVVANVIRDEDDEEYDPFNPAVGSVASVVKVTSRKSSFPQSMQANRTLLVKAMSEAEKSIATKKKVAVTRPMNRQPSPGEYSPKRKRSLTHRETASPPPYIPSRKVGSGAGLSTQSTASRVAVVRQKVLSQNDIRHALGREDNRGLTSASRREEILRKASSARNSAHAISSSKTHSTSTTVQAPSSLRIGSNTDRESNKSQSASTEGAAYGREVRDFDRKSGDVKNLQITARVGPLRLSVSKRGSSEDDVSIPETDHRVTVSSDQSRESSEEPQTRPKTVSIKRSQVAAQAQSSEKPKSAHVRDAREDIQKWRQSKTLLAEVKNRGTRVISKLAREAVQKQCKAAVMSVTSSWASTPKAFVPDSRVVQCDSKPPSVKSERNDDSDTNEIKCDDDSGDSDVSDSKVFAKQSPRISRSTDRTNPKISPREDVKEDMEEMEDLSQMLESEDLESQLLLEEEEKNEFLLDLDDEELSHVVEEVAAEVGEPEVEKDDSKSSIRFIVTLDGVDEAQFDNRSGSSVTALSSAAGVINPVVLNQSVSTLPPSTPSRPPLAAAPPLPQLASTPAQAAAKIRPPKIQPFSISLRDSDDEHEEKVVTYIQARDIRVEGVSGESVVELSALQQARSQQRCRFWPACMAGSDCQYHHPTTHCKTFPNCKFGDKCLFIHPNCRFDSKCTRADCPYTHTSKRHPSQLAASPMPPPRQYPRYLSMPQPVQNITCHFFPNCLNPSCPFVHPKSCMYGSACKNPTCSFYHPVSLSPPVVTSTVPDKEKLKWHAQPSVTVQAKVNNVKPTASSATVSSTSL